MNAITVCVEYHDFLARTLPSNAGHFEQVLVITTAQDHKTQEVVREVKNASCFTTNAFYRDGCEFNKGAAIEDAIDFLGREGWIALIDADTLLPRATSFKAITPGNLYLAQRRLCPSLDKFRFHRVKRKSEWPISEECLYLGGYFQLFHACDPVLAQKPWYPTGWRHAGGPGPEFIEKWAPGRRHYFPWHVTHIGPPRENWFGRVTRWPNGDLPREHRPREKRMAQLALDRERCGLVKERV